MTDVIENPDSPNGENNEGAGEGQPDVVPKEKFVELSDKNKQLFERAKKAEGELKELKAKAETPKETPEAPKSQSNEPDYARLAYLETKGIVHPDDQKTVQDEAERLKLPLTDVLAMEHIKARLEASKEDREAKAGMPKGKGRGAGTTQHDVDYWVGKEGLPDDQDLAAKVVEARMGKEKKANMFSDELF